VAAPSRACAGKKLIHKDALDSQQPGLIEYLFPLASTAPRRPGLLCPRTTDPRQAPPNMLGGMYAEHEKKVFGRKGVDL